MLEILHLQADRKINNQGNMRKQNQCSTEHLSKIIYRTDSVIGEDLSLVTFKLRSEE